MQSIGGYCSATKPRPKLLGDELRELTRPEDGLAARVHRWPSANSSSVPLAFHVDTAKRGETAC